MFDKNQCFDLLIERSDGVIDLCEMKYSKEEYLQIKQNADNHFSTFFEGNCFYGRHAIYINDFNIVIII